MRSYGLDEKIDLKGMNEMLLQGASVLKLTRANFERNTANLSQKTSKKLGLSGGAIFATGSVKIQLDSSEFSENVAESIGGAMAILVNATDKNAPGIALKDVEFRGNLAEDLGGAVAIQVIFLSHRMTTNDSKTFFLPD